MGKIRSSNREASQPVQRSAIDAATEAALCNWGQWAAVRVGMRRQAHGLFKRAGRCNQAPMALQVVNVDAAWQAEKTVCNPVFSPRYRALLTAHYVEQADKTTTCRTVGIHWSAYDDELWRAAAFFRNRCNMNGLNMV